MTILLLPYMFAFTGGLELQLQFPNPSFTFLVCEYSLSQNVSQALQVTIGTFQTSRLIRRILLPSLKCWHSRCEPPHAQ